MCYIIQVPLCRIVKYKSQAGLGGAQDDSACSVYGGQCIVVSLSACVCVGQGLGVKLFSFIFFFGSLAL